MNLVAVIPQPDPTWGFGLGGALFLLSLTAVWAGLHLRSNTHQRLRVQVDLAYAGLTEQSIAAFQLLRRELDTILPDTTGSVDPELVVADPSLVGKAAKRAIHILKQRQRINRRFEQMLFVCSCLKYVATVFSILVFLSTVLYFLEFNEPDVWQRACLLTGLSVGAALILVVTYSIYETQIQKSIEESDPIEPLAGAIH